MYELLLRTETLFMGLDRPVLLGIGIGALLAGLILWLGGTRYSTVIIGLLGAVIGSAVGLMVSQWLELHVWISMLIGAAVLGALSVMLRNVLILVLAVLVVAGLSGGGYLAVVLDRMAEPPETETQEEFTWGRQPEGRQAVPYQSFSGMDRSARLNYVDEISGQEKTFSERLAALIDDTWQALRPRVLEFGAAAVVGGLLAVVLLWLIKTALIALAYSVVGTAVLFLGLQTGLLGVDYPAVSALDARPMALPAAFVAMTFFGWLFQLVISRKKKPRKEERESKESD